MDSQSLEAQIENKVKGHVSDLRSRLEERERELELLKQDKLEKEAEMAATRQAMQEQLDNLDTAMQELDLDDAEFQGLPPQQQQAVLKVKCEQVDCLFQVVTDKNSKLEDGQVKLEKSKKLLAEKQSMVKHQEEVLKAQEGQLHEVMELISNQQETLESFRADSAVSKKMGKMALAFNKSKQEQSVKRLLERADNLEKIVTKSTNSSSSDDVLSGQQNSYQTREDGDGTHIRPSARHGQFERADYVVRVQNNLLCSIS